MRPRALAAWLVLWLAGAGSGAAQDASILADQVELTGGSTIVASGSVEVLYGDARLRASRLIFDDDSGILTIEGPIVLERGESTVVLADSAELDREMRNGIMRSARLVIDGQMQVAATEIQRVDGRYTQMYQSVASSCQVCADNPIPLWQIRARKVVHDDVEKQMYFHDAQFRALGVPIAYMPRLRMPDPTVERYTGFLVPQIVESDRIGSGVRVPYFITLGDSADITLLPYVTTRSRTLGARYREVFTFGEIEFDGALSSDDLESGIRGYLFGEGRFRLPRGYRLTFDIEQVTDSSYLLDYDFSGKDRLSNNIEVSRTRRDAHSEAGFSTFDTLRGSELEVEDQLPNIQGYVLHEQRFQPESIGGIGSWQISLDTHSRQSDVDVLGRDVTRVGGQAQWSRTAFLGNGMIGKLGGALAADVYNIRQDDNYDPYLSHVVPAVQAELRWPLQRFTATGGSEVLEPVISVVWSEQYGDIGPNEASTLVEFDEGNLYAMSRFPGYDRYEVGLRAAAGLSWTHYTPRGWSWNLTGGRVFRAEDLGQFSRASGLDGQNSDWLLGTQVRMDDRLAVGARLLLAPNYSIPKAETRLTWNSDRLDLITSFSRIVADPEENRPDINSQIQIGGKYDVSRNWLTNFDVQYDATAQETTRAELGLTYRNECISVDFSVSRRFTSSSNVVPSTKFGFSIGLNGFGTDGRRYSRSCSG